MRTLIPLLSLLLPFGLRAQCYGSFQYPGNTTAADDSGAPVTISTCNWAGDYALVSLVAGRSYRFTSTAATDHITVSTALGIGVLGFGTQPLVVTATATQVHYVHYHAHPACGTENICRTTGVQRVYCPAGSSICGGTDESIINLSFGSIHNPSSGCSGGGYSDFSQGPATNLLPGQPTPITVVNAAPFAGDQVHAFLDWNRDFTLGDPGEVFILNTTDNITFTGSITPPPGTSAGSVRLRVRLTYTGTVPPCGTTTYGEVEDYTVYVVGSPLALFAGGNGRGDAASLMAPTILPSNIFIGGNGSGDVASLVTPVIIPTNIFAGGNGRGDVASLINPTPILNNIFSGGNGRGDVVTLIIPSLNTQGVLLALRGVLEGPYNSTTGQMSDALRAAGIVPTTEPYTALGYVQVGGGGAESIAPAVLATTGNNAIVDWVVVELRNATTPTTVLATRSALIQRDGDIVATDGVSPLTFNQPPGTYHVALRHRNHLGVMTGTATPLGLSTTPLDLAAASTGTFGTSGRKSVAGAFPAEVLWAGDVTFNGQLKYTGTGNDRDPILQRIGGSLPTNFVNGYWREDCTMDGVVKYTGSGNDRDPILLNIGGTVPTATRNAQIP